jgi:diacylglycerol kinase (ATP)
MLVVANPQAGLRRGGRRAGERAARAAAEAGVRVDLHLTSAPGDAQVRAAEAVRAGYDLVVAAGGDGTAHEVANGLAGTDVPLGVAPAGTMNLLARVTGTPLDAADAAARLARGFRTAPMRPGEVAGRVFLLMAGCGFDAWVLRELLRSVPGKIGFTDYVRGAIGGLRTFPFAELCVRWEGREHRAHTVITGRAPLYGGFLRPTPEARLDAARLDVCLLDGGLAQLAAVVPRMWSGAHAGLPGVIVARTAEVDVDSRGIEVPYQLDGELAGVLPATFAVSSRAVVLAVPQTR